MRKTRKQLVTELAELKKLILDEFGKVRVSDLTECSDEAFDALLRVRKAAKK